MQWDHYLTCYFFNSTLNVYFSDMDFYYTLGLPLFFFMVPQISAVLRKGEQNKTTI